MGMVNVTSITKRDKSTVSGTVIELDDGAKITVASTSFYGYWLAGEDGEIFPSLCPARSLGELIVELESGWHQDRN